MIRLVPYDDTWPLEFEAEAERITRGLAGLPLRLEHIGSTAVPGLAGRPIVDLAAGRPSRSHVGEYIAALKQLGYEHSGNHGVPGREYFRRGEPRSHHIHLVALNGALWRDCLAFRDALRADARLAREYEAVRRELVRVFADDPAGYAKGKNPFIRNVLRHADGAEVG